MKHRRTLVSILLIVALLATGAMRAMVQRQREAILPRPPSASRLSGMDSFALGLLLGGLRGPLVMILWASIENQKIDKNLEDIDTKIDLIRMLQDKFDSVHLFQIWNKAYNLSVMMVNLQNKYATILDALDYAHSVDEERPDNVNILAQMGEVYFQKLGIPMGSGADKRYYVSRMARETLPKQTSAKIQKGQPGWRRTQHDSLLDSRGFILPQLLQPRPELGNLVTQGYTGAELQFLAPYNTPQAEGFPYGVPPLALAYNYYKRAAVLQQLTGRKHLYLSEGVIDSRAAVALKFWAEDAWEQARRFEAQAFGKPLPDERMSLEPLTASARPDAPFVDRSETTRKLVEEAIFTYRRAVVISHHAESEYRTHVANPSYSSNADIYFSHIDSAAAMADLLAGDRDYLSLIAAAAPFDPPIVLKPQIASLRQSAAQHYRRAIDLYYLMILKYYTDDAVAAVVYPADDDDFAALKHYVGDNIAAMVYPWAVGRRIDKNTIQKVDPKRYPEVYQAAEAYMARNMLTSDYREDIMEYQAYIRRATERLGQLAR